jgi:hypothetical protein
LNAINVEGTFFWPLHQHFWLQSTQNLGISVATNKNHGCNAATMVEMLSKDSKKGQKKLHAIG